VVVLVLLAAIVALAAVWPAQPGLGAANPAVDAPTAAQFAAKLRQGETRDRADERRRDAGAGATGAGSQGRAAGSEPKRERVGAGAVRRDLSSRSVEEVCGDLGGEIVNGLPLCTHGPDPAPPGLNPAAPVAPLRRNQVVPTVACIGDGASGSRIEVLYVYPSDVAGGNRYDQYLGSFRVWVAEMDTIFSDSAALTDGERRLRIVTDDGCRPLVTPVGVRSTALASFGGSIDAVVARGYDRTDRNYLMFVDAEVLCGIGTVRGDDRPGQNNWNNTGGGYARVDAGCWDGFTAAHEVMHNLGGVQPGAPNDSGGWHCTDESDVMCYRDAPRYPEMRDVCSAGPWANLALFDCGQDDYFSANPTPGSYLTRKWNTANSRFLVDPATQPGSDSISDPPPPAATPALDLSVDEGPVGGRVAVNVLGFPAGEALALAFDGIAAGSATVDGSGAARLTLTTPADVAGDYTVTVAAGAARAEASFRIVPAARAAQPQNSRGPVVVNLTGFAGGEQIAVRLGGGAALAVVADASGSASTRIAVPPRAKGKRPVTAVGAAGNEAADTVNLGKSTRRSTGNTDRARGGAVAGGGERPVLTPSVAAAAAADSDGLDASTADHDSAGNDSRRDE
jgi:hypothetical protein